MPELAIDLESGIDDDGIIEDLHVETYYCPLEFLLEAAGYVRVIGDSQGHDVEIRIPFDELKKLGWSKQ